MHFVDASTRFSLTSLLALDAKTESEVNEMDVKENLQLMKTLDDAWNAGPGSPLWETFNKRHNENVAVY